jgi:hypothetical protein
MLPKPNITKMKKTLLILAAFCLLFTACNERCTDFYSPILSWIPYKVGDTISFNKNGEILRFIVTETYINHTEKINKRTKCACSNQYGFSAGNDSSYIRFNAYDDHDITNSDLEICDGTHYASSSQQSFHNRTPLSEITINHVTYRDLIVFSNDAADTSIWKVIFANNKGIVAFFCGDSVLNEPKDLVRLTNTANYNIKETSCD